MLNAYSFDATPLNYMYIYYMYLPVYFNVLYKERECHIYSVCFIIPIDLILLHLRGWCVVACTTLYSKVGQMSKFAYA